MPKTEKKSRRVDVSPELWKRLRLHAIARDQTVPEALEELLIKLPRTAKPAAKAQPEQVQAG